MRHVSPQLPLTAPWINHAHAAELAAMSELLDEQPALAQQIQQDLEAACPTNPRTGRPGLAGEQTLRVLVVRQLTGGPMPSWRFTWPIPCRIAPFVVLAR